MGVASEIGESVSSWLVLVLITTAVFVAGLALFVKLRDDRRGRAPGGDALSRQSSRPQ
jgi:hypothetical protein